jgi:hypothetical protein
VSKDDGESLVFGLAVGKRTIARREEQRKLKATEWVWEEKRTGPVEPTKRLLSIFHDDDHREDSSLVHCVFVLLPSPPLPLVPSPSCYQGPIYTEAAWR